MEAFTASEGGSRDTGGRGGPRLLRLQSDERLVALLREGDEAAFEAIVARYRARLFGFCRKMLGSPQDAEDVLQEVLANAYRAMLADQREIQLRPWLFRIARNRCLNHLQRLRPVLEEQERLERVPAAESAATHARVQNREEFLSLLDDIGELPEAQRQALLLREFDGLSYEDVGREMGASVPAVRSLLTRARAALGEGSASRELSCAQIRLQIEDTLQGGERLPGPARRHVRGCEGCREFADAVGADSRAVAALSPLGMLVAFKELIASKLGAGGGAATAGGAGAAAGGGGLAAGAGLGGWATGSKLAATTVAVAVVAGGAGGGIAASTDPGPAARIAPAVPQAEQPAAPANPAPSGATPESPAAPEAGAALGEPAAPGETTAPGHATAPDLPGAYVVPPSTYPDGAPTTSGETTTTTPVPATGHETAPAQP